ncbi:hypothetical protein ACRAQ6_13885 [Erythrobacter sp. HA6-11]
MFNPFTILGAKIFAGLFGAAAIVAATQTVRINGIGCEYFDRDSVTGEQKKPDCWWNGYKASNAIVRIDLVRMTALREVEAENHRTTKVNYRAAQVAAADRQKKRVDRIKRQQKEITDAVSSSFERRIADSRRNYERLLDHERTARANLESAAGTMRLPRAGEGASEIDEEARHRRLSTKYPQRVALSSQLGCPEGRVCLSREEAQIATEQAIQLDELIAFQEEQEKVRVD